MNFKIYVRHIFLLCSVGFLSNYGACADLNHARSGSNHTSNPSSVSPVNLTLTSKPDSHDPSTGSTFHLNSTPELKRSSPEIKTEKSQPHAHVSNSRNVLGNNASLHSIVHADMYEETVLKLTDDDYDLIDQSHPTHKTLPISKFHPVFSTIAAVLSITIAVGGYVLLMCWRRMEMKKYGNRQMLINEDDFGDIQDEDMRHFEMQDLRSVRANFSSPHWKTIPSLSEP